MSNSTIKYCRVKHGTCYITYNKDGKKIEIVGQIGKGMFFSVDGKIVRGDMDMVAVYSKVADALGGEFISP